MLITKNAIHTKMFIVGQIIVATTCIAYHSLPLGYSYQFRILTHIQAVEEIIPNSRSLVPLIIGQHQHTGIFLKRALIITTRVNPSLLPMGQEFWTEKFFCFSSLFCPRMIDKVGKLSYNNLWLHTPHVFFHNY